MGAPSTHFLRRQLLSLVLFEPSSSLLCGPMIPPVADRLHISCQEWDEKCYLPKLCPWEMGSLSFSHCPLVAAIALIFIPLCLQKDLLLSQTVVACLEALMEYLHVKNQETGKACPALAQLGLSPAIGQAFWPWSNNTLKHMLQIKPSRSPREINRHAEVYKLIACLNILLDWSHSTQLPAGLNPFSGHRSLGHFWKD